jgi:hypothetical protein
MTSDEIKQLIEARRLIKNGEELLRLHLCGIVENDPHFVRARLCTALFFIHEAIEQCDKMQPSLTAQPA